jgi:predicted RNA-binding Zn-ribbon protein involved in translation (DUF1610 family)
MEKYGAIVCEDCKVEMEEKADKFVCLECGKEKPKDEIQTME